jgi:two-component system, sensor histidine kinase PdtaS
MPASPEAERYERQQRLLAEFSRDAVQNTQLEQLLEQAVLRVAQALDVERTKIMQYRAELADLFVVAGTGWHDGFVGHARLGVDIMSPAGRALQTAQPVAIDDLPNSAGFRRPPMLAEHGIISLVNVPIFADGMVWGVLEVDSREPRHFTRIETDLLAAFAGFLGSALQRKNTEAETARVARDHAESLLRHELLVRELQHRMKNNLQIILSLIGLQQKKLADPAARSSLTHIANRVIAIALAQDQLSTTQQLRSIGLGAYLRALCAYIETGRDDIMIECQAEDLDVSVDQAIPAGLIVNEAVTNAVKHAFEEQGGTIRVIFRSDPRSKEATLLVSDNGRGTAGTPAGGSGLELIEALASQLGGVLERPASPPNAGTTLGVTFPLRL